MEEWRDVVGYEGYYMVSSYGRVKRVDRMVGTGIRHSDGRRMCKCRILHLNLKQTGYYHVDLSARNIIKTVPVHRLVATAFIENPDNKPAVNHKNLIKTDNRVQNLEWVTYQENSQHAAANGVMYGGLRKLIRCCETGQLFLSSYKAGVWLNETKYHNSKQLDSMAKNIRACCSGKRPTAYGYHWKDVIQEGSTTIPKGSTHKRVEMAGISDEEMKI